MIRRTALVALLALGMVTPAMAKKPYGINAREYRQKMRIKDGVEDGQLTKGEVNRLRADEAAVRAEERVYRSDGSLNRWERRDLNRDLNQTSREIYRLKHNSRRPG